MTLREKFYKHYKGKIFTTKEALSWYQQHKANPSAKATYSNLYQLILWPLSFEGLLVKLTAGSYKLEVEAIQQPLEDWDKHIAKKMKE